MRPSSSSSFGIQGLFERMKMDWIDPAWDYIDNARPKTDSHLNEVSIEYAEEDIKEATHNFDSKMMLGSGTFGSVYKGTMEDGTEVAIKVLQVPQEAGFEDEVKVLSRFRHPNLVILMGFARHVSTGGRSLIYEYLSGGDVSKRLLRSRQLVEPFEWRSRLSAMVDAACGLSHLHNTKPRAFHRDIKAPNILLDRNGTAKMADFGLSCVSTGAHYKVAQASGTVGYACPEYIRTGIITEGSEVHSYGMVILEVLTGAPPAVARQDKPTEFVYLVDHLGGSQSKVIQMLDNSAHFPLSVAQALTEFSFRCIQRSQSERPLFKQIVEELRQMYQQSSHQYEETPLRSRPPHPEASGAAPKASLEQTQSAGATAQGQGQSTGSGQNRFGVRRVPLTVGTPIECQWKGRSGWFCGHIVRVNTNGTFAIKYSDGEVEDNVAAQFIRPMELPLQQAQGGSASRQRSEDPLLRNSAGKHAIASNLKQAAAAGSLTMQRSPSMKGAGPGKGASLGGKGSASLSGGPGAPLAVGVGVGVGVGGGDFGPIPSSGIQGVSGNSANPGNPGGSLGAAMARTKSLSSASVSVSGSVQAVHSYRLRCIYAEGVELQKLQESERTISWPSTSNELVIGRTSQPPEFWNVLAPDNRLQSTISRSHFRLQTSLGPNSDSQAGGRTTLKCLSQNGMLHNQLFVSHNEERTINAGDTVALAVSAQIAGGYAGSHRRSFIVFSFENLAPREVTLPPPLPIQPNRERGVAALGKIGGHNVGANAGGDSDHNLQSLQYNSNNNYNNNIINNHNNGNFVRPGSAGGHNFASRIDDEVEEDAEEVRMLFCLEVHGEDIDTSIPSAARQLFICCETTSPLVPTLRIGRGYQRHFWQRVVKQECLLTKRWRSMVSLDHFEISCHRRTNPMSSEPPDWRFKLHVLGSMSVTLNYSTVCNFGDDPELKASDTLTVGEAACEAKMQEPRGESSSIALPIGLHFTFIPFVGSMAIGEDSDLVPATERARPLPDFWGDEKEPSASPNTQQQRMRRPTLPNRAATVRSAPTLKDAKALRPPGGSPQAELGDGEFFRGQAVVEEEDDDDDDPDDLFSKTG
eukprot:CAMPEP_0206427828 /NCGR_PEP_ID=MMETSP0324_2-20121206/5279_1 /ASSEMBLY_ACC=CAM_ASM_000836 /TAXON_ID=2866 /ORGANISM="Crypthecodinium cohnii, Strain Seligo" /LENGTH=1086 /DNA_ID=CAMNT_0053893195 /DNA_START=93 /DNA_END=3350 /DNA_ORIENTATION=-